jgi:two-component system, OmpR family, sensor kinase
MLGELDGARTETEDALDRQRQFVADASHELRTPLTTIRGFAELYRQGAAGSPADAARLVRRIEDEAARMGLLVEDLLLLARLDQERPLRLAPVELPVVVADAVEAARAVAADRPVTLEVHTDGVPLVVEGDDARLRQVVDNLVGNAMTHTPAGVAVTVRLLAEPDQGVIEVADQGPGLSAEQAERVFERFYRVDSARSRAAGGTGLGLAIVAALVAAHRGTVEVESTPGAGATFRVRLPLAASGSGAAGPPGEAGPDSTDPGPDSTDPGRDSAASGFDPTDPDPDPDPGTGHAPGRPGADPAPGPGQPADGRSAGHSSRTLASP